MAKQQLKKVSKKRVTTKKITRRRRKNMPSDIQQGMLIDLDQFYKAVNRVQLAREIFTFIIKETDRGVFENILKDLNLPFTSKKHSLSQCEYIVSPGPERTLNIDTDEIDSFPDEIAEDGQVFFI